MTIEERARKICEPRETNGLNLDQRQRELLIPLIAAQLREVEREAYSRGHGEAYPNVIEMGDRKAFDLGFNAAKEKAAGMVEERWVKVPGLAERIRAM